MSVRALSGVRRLARRLIRYRNGALAAPSLPDVFTWASSFDVAAKPWLVLGKGPSYQHIRDVRVGDFFTCSLNHVVREMPVDLAHIIDIDVVEACQDVLEQHARTLVLPYFPHVRHEPTSKTLAAFAAELPVLRRLEERGRLVWYNLSSAPWKVPSSPVITARFFSAEAAVGILAACGVKTIRTLGVDGGTTYAAAYHDLNDKTLLANTHSSFDRQFEEIARTIRTKRIFYAPLHKEAPIRVFVGTDASQMLAARVLEYSIAKHASMSVEVVPLRDVAVPRPRDPANAPRTGFSFARFVIPALCQYRGRAIYLDADMLVFADIAKLWDMPFGTADLLCAEQPTDRGRRRQYSVMLLNCAALPWRIEEIVRGLDEGRYDYGRLMHDFCIVPDDRIAATVPSEWNSLERHDPGRTCLLHYTDMPSQPWVSRRNPHGDLWYRALREALAEGFLAAEEVYDEVARGHVAPDLPAWAGMKPAPDAPRLRRTWIPPYRRVQPGPGVTPGPEPLGRRMLRVAMRSLR